MECLFRDHPVFPERRRGEILIGHYQPRFPQRERGSGVRPHRNRAGDVLLSNPIHLSSGWIHLQRDGGVFEQRGHPRQRLQRDVRIRAQQRADVLIYVGGRGDRYGLLPAAVVHGVQARNGFRVSGSMEEGRRAGRPIKLGRAEARGAGVRA